MKWTCFIPGEPIPRREKRVTFKIKTADGPRTINKLADDPKVAKIKETVRSFVMGRRPSRLLEGPLSLTIWIYRQRPKTAPKRVTLPVTKPDWTNCTKLAEDCLIGIVIVDDALVVEANVYKRFATTAVPPGLFIEVQELSGEDIPLTHVQISQATTREALPNLTSNRGDQR